MVLIRVHEGCHTLHCDSQFQSQMQNHTGSAENLKQQDARARTRSRGARWWLRHRTSSFVATRGGFSHSRMLSSCQYLSYNHPAVAFLLPSVVLLSALQKLLANAASGTPKLGYRNNLKNEGVPFAPGMWAATLYG